MIYTTLPDFQIDAFRQQFPALANKLYLNYGGQGPMSQRSLTAIQQAHEYIQQSGPFSGVTNRWIAQQEKQIREAMAEELGVAPETLTLTEDVTVGCNIALWGLDWQAGDHVLLSDCEHPGVIGAILEIQRRFGIEVTTCPLGETLNQGDPIAILREHLRPQTRLVVVSHILWNTGQVLPIAAMAQVCRAASVLMLVDAAQSVGVLPLNLKELGADFYAFTGHKWWCGPAGVGGLYVRPESQALLQPTFIGWRSVTKDAAGYPTGLHPDGRRYEVATSDFALYAGLQEAFKVHQAWGTPEQRYQRILVLSHYLWQKLRDLPELVCLRSSPPEAGLVSFKPQDGVDPNHLVQFLEQEGIMVRTILDPYCVRACVHYFTLESEIDQLVETIHQFFKTSPQSGGSL
jgi:L-cysteine/cystine lyase